MSSNFEKSHREDGFGLGLKEGRNLLRSGRERQRGKREVREKRGLKKDTEVHIMSEGRRVRWRNFGEDRLVEIAPVVTGGEKKQKRTGTLWKRLVSESEKG